LAERPVDKDGLAVNVLPIDRAPDSTVVGRLSMVPEHEVVVRLDISRRAVLMIEVARRNVRLGERLVIDENASLLNIHPLSGKANHPLDVRFRGIQGIQEDDDVAPTDLLKAVDELIDEDSLVIDQPGHHAGPFHLHRLIQEHNDNESEEERKDKISHPVASVKKAPPGARGKEYTLVHLLFGGRENPALPLAAQMLFIPQLLRVPHHKTQNKARLKPYW
jgi:hypothetical protein